MNRIKVVRLIKSVMTLVLLGVVAAGCQRNNDSGKITPGARRIVSLAPSITEILFAIGAQDQLVGRTDVCDSPAAATNVAIVGSFGRPSLDALAAVRPTHVCWVDLEDRDLPPMFARLGWQGEKFACQRLDDIPSAIEALGALTDTAQTANRLATELREGIASRRAHAPPPGLRPTVLVVVWWTPLMTTGRNSFVSDIVVAAGGRLVTDTIERDYFTVSDEWALQQDPDVILCLDYTAPGDSLNRLRQTTGWRALQAVKDGRVYNHIDPNILYRPGPNVLQAIDQVHALLYSDTPAVAENLSADCEINAD